MKERFVMTSLMASAYADITSTFIGLNNGFHEVGFLGSQMAEHNAMTHAYISRIAVTAIFIGIYALSKENPSRFTFSVDRAARIGNLLSWGAVTLNALQFVVK